jgi:O-antigen/teichoic acid export membrane protein
MKEFKSLIRQRVLGLMPGRVVYVRNLGTSWLAYGAALIVAFFLSPFIIHSLGDTAYGFWTLLMSMTGYLGLIDMGVRVSTGRYLNYYLGINDEEAANTVINTSLVAYTVAGVLIVIAALLLGRHFGDVFKNVPASLARQATSLLPLLALSIWLSLYSSVLGQVLIARERFDIKNISDVLILAARTAATVVVIKADGGLPGLASVIVCSSAVECLLLYTAVRLLKIPFRLNLWHVTRKSVRELLSYTSWSFLINAGSRIINYTDAAVIALLLGIANVTIYSIGFMLIDYGTNLMAHVVGVMTPEIYKQAGRNDLAALRRLVVDGARNTMFFSVPLLVGLIMLGGSFIRLWMGPGYEASADILLILAVAQSGLLANRGCGAVLWGLGSMRVLAIMTLSEAIANLTLSIMFAAPMGFGIRGIALGTAIPMIVIGWLVIPYFACQKIQLSLLEYLRLTAARWIPASVLLMGIVAILNRFIDTTTWLQFTALVALVIAIYLPIGWFLMLRPNRMSNAATSLSPA